MDKHEILRKARASKNDEREKLDEIKSYQFSWIGVTIIISLLLLFRYYHGESTTDLIVIVLTQLTFRAFYQFLKEKDTYHTLSFILSLGGLILVTILLLNEYGVV